MKSDFIGRMLMSLILACVALILGYFVEPLMAVLGLLMSLSTVLIGFYVRKQNKRE